MCTFDVSDVPLGAKPLTPATVEATFHARLGARVEACASNLPDLVETTLHGLVGAAHHAFMEHHPLVLSPDDVWLCIAQGFAQHVDANAEELRGRFVKHEGKVPIVVRRDDFVKGSSDNDWPGCFAEFSDQISGQIGQTRDLVVAEFSTTGPIEKAASEIVLMSAMRHYFDYMLLTICGIPRVTLLGNVADWMQIRRRAELLGEYDLGWWMSALVPVLDQVVAAAEGRPDRAFWRSFYKWRDHSGGPYVSGWINVLFPYVEDVDDAGSPSLARNEHVTRWAETFDEEFDSGPCASQLPSGLSLAPFIWEYYGIEIAMEFVGGFAGVSQDPRTLAVRPAIGWAVRPGTQSPQ